MSDNKFDASLSRQLDAIIKTLESIRALPDSKAKREGIARYEKAKRRLEERIK